MEIPDSPLLCGCVVVVPLCVCDENVFVHPAPKTIVLQRAYYWVAGGQGIIVSRRWDANTARGPHLLTKMREDERERAKKGTKREEKDARPPFIQCHASSTVCRAKAQRPTPTRDQISDSPADGKPPVNARLARATGPVLQANLANQHQLEH